MAEAVKKGVEEAGGVAEIYQVAETLPDYVLDLYKAPPKPDYPVMSPLDMANGFDGYL